MKFNSIKFKISIIYVTILGAILILFSSILFGSLYYMLYNDFDRELNIKGREVSNALTFYLDITGANPKGFNFAVNRVLNFEIDENIDNPEIEALDRKWLQKIDKLDLKEDYIILLDSDAKFISSSRNLQEPPEYLKNINFKEKSKTSFRNIKFGSNKLRMITIPYVYKGEK